MPAKASTGGAYQDWERSQNNGSWETFSKDNCAGSRTGLIAASALSAYRNGGHFIKSYKKDGACYNNEDGFTLVGASLSSSYTPGTLAGLARKDWNNCRSWVSNNFRIEEKLEAVRVQQPMAEYTGGEKPGLNYQTGFIAPLVYYAFVMRWDVIAYVTKTIIYVGARAVATYGYKVLSRFIELEKQKRLVCGPRPY